MATFEAWDVVKVPFPYTARPIRQRRPALVIAAGDHLLWVLMVTSAENRGWRGDVEIDDLAAAGLPVASIVRTAKIATIEAREVARLGTLSASARARVAGCLRDVLSPAFGELALDRSDHSR